MTQSPCPTSRSSDSEPVEILRRDGDLAAEARVQPDVVQFGGRLRIVVKTLSELLSRGGFPSIVVVGPDCRGLDHQGFTIRVEGVGHISLQETKGTFSAWRCG
jgi:hypothetical protein